MTRWANVVLGSIAGLALASMAVGNAVDRFAKSGTGTVLRLPIVTGPNHASRLSADALERGDLPAAAKLSRTALAAQPLDERASRVLGTVALMRRDVALGDRMMRFAGARGWRDPQTQLYWARAALDAGDPVVASQRLDAVLRGARPDDPEREQAIGLLQLLEASPGGRAAIIARLREQPFWRDDYIPATSGLDRAGMRRRLALIALARRNGIALPKATFVALEWSLVNTHEYALAMQVCRAAVPGCGATPIADGGFNRFDAIGRPGPFAWTAIPSSDVEITLADGADGPALRVVSSGALSTPLIRQVVMLSPGIWRITGRAVGARGVTPLAAQLACLTRGTGTTRPVAATPGRFVVEVSVPADCPAQMLQLDLADTERTDGTGTGLMLDDISAQRAASH